MAVQFNSIRQLSNVFTSQWMIRYFITTRPSTSFFCNCFYCDFTEKYSRKSWAVCGGHTGRLRWRQRGVKARQKKTFTSSEQSGPVNEEVRQFIVEATEYSREQEDSPQRTDMWIVKGPWWESGNEIMENAKATAWGQRGHMGLTHPRSQELCLAWPCLENLHLWEAPNCRQELTQPDGTATGECERRSRRSKANRSRQAD